MRDARYAFRLVLRFGLVASLFTTRLGSAGADPLAAIRAE